MDNELPHSKTLKLWRKSEPKFAPQHIRNTRVLRFFLSTPPSPSLLRARPSHFLLLFPTKGGLEQALSCCDCLSPPLRWIRIPLEVLPPPTCTTPSTSASPTRRVTINSSPEQAFSGTEQHSPATSSGSRGGQKQQKRDEQQDGFRGVRQPPPDSVGRGAAQANRTSPFCLDRGGARTRPVVVVAAGKKSAEQPGAGRGVRPSRLAGGASEGILEDEAVDGGGGEEGATAEEMVEGAAKNRGGGGDNGGRRRLRQREVANLWWLTGMYICISCRARSRGSGVRDGCSTAVRHNM